MANRTLTRVSGGTSETIHINTDKFAGVRTMQKNGQDIHVDRTAPVINSDPSGASRPLLSKVVGGATAAFSLRDLKDKQGNNKVIRVRREKDSEEVDFLAKDVPQIADFVNGKTHTDDLPANVGHINLYSNFVEALTYAVSFSVPFSDNSYGFGYAGIFTPNANGTVWSFLGQTFTQGSNGWIFFANVGTDYIQIESYDGLTPFPWQAPWTSVSISSSNSTIANATPSVWRQYASLQAGHIGTVSNSAEVALSLRKVNSSYTGHAVRIRRTSDNVEVNVSFDTNGEVSTSSAITNLNPSNLPSGITSFTVTGANSSSGEANGTYVLNTSNNRWFNGSSYFYASGNSWRQYDDAENEGIYLFGTTDGEYPWQVTYSGSDNPVTPSNFSNLVGPDSGDTTATTLGEFLTEGGTHSAAVHTWYDQSGSSNNATQTQSTKQPLIAGSGIIKTQGGKPCLDFDGVDDVLQFSAPNVQSGNIRSVFVACSAPTSQNTSVMGTEGEFLIKRDSSRAISQNNFGASRLNSDFSFSGTGNHLVTVIRNFTASTSSLLLDGDVDATRTDSYGLNSVHQIGGKKSGSNIIEEADFNCLEVIVYAGDQTPAARFKIESNINNYYGIYTPNGGDGFVSRWYDQSGFDHHVSQGNSATQPKIVTNGNLVVDGTGRTAISGTGAKLTFAPNRPVFSSDGTHSLFCVGDFNNQTGGADNFADVVAFTPLTQSGAANRKPRIIIRQNDGRMVVSTSSFDIADGNHSVFVSLSETLAANLISTIGNPNLSTANHVVHVNGVQKLSSNAHTIINTETLTAGSASLFDQAETTVEHFLTEVIYYPADQRLNRPAIEANIANQWGITLS